MIKRYWIYLLASLILACGCQTKRGKNDSAVDVENMSDIDTMTQTINTASEVEVVRTGIETNREEENFNKVKTGPALNNTSLQNMMWEFVSDCRSSIEDPEFEENFYNEIIDDAKNGYLSISGSWPTCGCSCSSTVGAYRKADGTYILLKDESWSCSSNHGIYSSKSLKKILPSNFGVNTFAPSLEQVVDTLTYGYFYITASIPRLGTETILSLQLIPFGIENRCVGGICNSIITNEEHPTYLIEISDLVEEIISNDMLMLLVEGSFDNVDKATKDMLNSFYENEYRTYTQDDFTEQLRRLHDVYKIYQELNYSSLILDWDREAGRFYVKGKKSINTSMTFLEFLKKGNFYSPSC